MRKLLTRSAIPVLLFWSMNLSAQDIKGGDIRIIQTGNNQYYAVIHLYQSISNFVYRPYLIINWGDSSPDTCNMNTWTSVGPDLAISDYPTHVHTFAGPGTYTLTVADSFWVSGLSNVVNSGNEPFFMSATIVSNPFVSTENSPTFTSLPYPVGYNDGTYSYNLNAFDQDGDSLSYKLINACGNYSYPPNTSIDPVTGDLTMIPTVLGSYVVAIEVTEWRHINSNYLQVGSNMQKMVIDVDNVRAVPQVSLCGTIISTYPDPATDELIFDMGGYLMSDGELLISDMLGRNVKQIGILNENRIEISVRDLAEGVYSYDLTENGKCRVVGKVVVKK